MLSDVEALWGEVEDLRGAGAAAAAHGAAGPSREDTGSISPEDRPAVAALCNVPDETASASHTVPLGDDTAPQTAGIATAGDGTVSEEYGDETCTVSDDDDATTEPPPAPPAPPTAAPPAAEPDTSKRKRRRRGRR